MNKTTKILLSILIISTLLSCKNSNKNNLIESLSDVSVKVPAFEDILEEKNSSKDVSWVTKTESDYSKSIKYFALIDNNSNILIPYTSDFAEVEDFSDDRAWVKFNDERKNLDIANWGIIDKTGKIIVRFNEVQKGQHTQFSEGFCLAESSYEFDSPLYVISKNGDLIPIDRNAVPQGSPFNISFRNLFKDGYALCKDIIHEQHMYYIKTDGSILILKEYQKSPLPDFQNLNIYDATDFENGKARVTFIGVDGLHYFVYIDKNGNMIDTPTPISYMNP